MTRLVALDERRQSLAEPGSVLVRQVDLVILTLLAAVGPAPLTGATAAPVDFPRTVHELAAAEAPPHDAYGGGYRVRGNGQGATA